MTVKNDALPLSRISIDKRGNLTTLTLWDGTYRTVTDGEGETMYEYEIYQMRANPRHNLAESVEAKFNLWYEAAKKAETPLPEKPTLDDLASQLIEAQIAIMELCLE